MERRGEPRQVSQSGRAPAGLGEGKAGFAHRFLVSSRIKSKPAATPDFSFELDDDEMEIFNLSEKSHLSKSERRRLRKLQKRQKRAG